MGRLALLVALAAACCRLTSGGLRHGRAEGQDELQRPIITGCLLECGVQDQTCVTQCQVCVEEHKCRNLKSEGCGMCLRGVKTSVYERASAHGVAIDSGGVPMAQQGIRLRLQAARFHKSDEVRHARDARDAVLVAQRQVEWATEEWLDGSKKLHYAKDRVEHAHDEKARSRTEHAKKIKGLESRIATTQMEITELENELLGLQRKLNRTGRVYHDADNVEAKDRQAARDTAREWAVRRHLGALKRMEKHLQEQLKYEEEHAHWLDHGLEKDVEQAQQAKQESVDRVQHARALTRLAEQNLKEAKDRYRVAQARSLNASRVEEQLESMVKERLQPIMPQPAMSHEGGTNQTVPQHVTPAADGAVSVFAYT